MVGNNYTDDSIITNCYNIGNVTGNGNDVGGIVGLNNSSTIAYCYNQGSVTGNKCRVGVVVGYNEECCAVLNCYNAGSIISNDGPAGDVVGYDYKGTITICYNTGMVNGKDNVGGVTSYTYLSTITSCYNTGVITGDNTVGGVASYISFVDVITCYNISNVTGDIDTGGVVGYTDDNYCDITNCYYYIDCCESDNSFGTPLTMEEMLLAESFAGFDFSSVWNMDGNPDYPYPELSDNIHVGTSIVSPEPGDANGDGSVTMADATIIASMALNLAVSVPAADFNGDGSINMSDATLTALKALNLIWPTM